MQLPASSDKDEGRTLLARQSNCNNTGKLLQHRDVQKQSDPLTTGEPHTHPLDHVFSPNTSLFWFHSLLSRNQQCTSPPSSSTSSCLSPSPNQDATKEPAQHQHGRTPSEMNPPSAATNSSAQVSRETSKLLAMTSIAWIGVGGCRCLLMILILRVCRGFSGNGVVLCCGM